MTEWRDITTAPRDGTRILVVRKQRAGPRLRFKVAIAHWVIDNRYNIQSSCWAIEITSNSYYSQDDNLEAWAELPKFTGIAEGDGSHE